LIKLGVSCLLVFAAIPTLADENAAPIDTIVVTASRLDSSASELSQAIEVITQNQIVGRQPQNVTELLRHAVGANVIQQGGRGGVTSIVLRGGEANFTVALIDGVKVNDPTNTRGGSYDFSYLDITNIERVEILRGPVSAIYGSDALAGVINIITRDSAAGSRVGIEIGGQGLRSIAMSFGGELNSVDATIGAQLVEDGGDIEGGGYEDWGVHSSLVTGFGESGALGLALRHQDGKSTGFPEDSGGPEFSVIRDADRRSVQESQARLYAENWNVSSWNTDLSLSHYQRDENFTSPGIAPGIFDGVPPISATTDFSRNQLVVSASQELSESLSFVVGGEWQNEEGVSAGSIDVGFSLPTDFRLERRTVSAFTEARYQEGPLTLHGGLRWDDVDRIDNETSAQLGVVYRLADGVSDIRANWGQGFKVPSFFALGHPLVGNPILESETATSADISFRRLLNKGSGSVELSIYKNNYSNLIDFDPVQFTMVNRSKVITQGVELMASFGLGDTAHVQGHLTYTDADIKDDDGRLRGRPRWRGSAVLDWSISDRWQLVTSFLLVDEFYEASIPTGGLLLDGYQRLDIALTLFVSDKLKIGFAIDNLLDEKYWEAVGFSAPGVRGRINATNQF